MAYETIEITREELYKKVWEQSCTQLSKEFGISDRGLAKICSRHRIPLPGIGYWAKVQAGYSLKQTKLPELLDKEVFLARILIIRTTHPICADQQVVDKIHQLIQYEKQNRNRGSVNPNGPLLHKFSLKLQRELSNSKLTSGRLLSNKFDVISVSEGSIQRALFILDTLLIAIEKRGFEVFLEKASFSKIYIDILGERVGFKIIETIRVERTELSKAERKKLEREDEYSLFLYDKKVNLIPSGILRLEIFGGLSYTYCDSTIKDGKMLIEDRLSDFFVAVYKTIQKKKAEKEAALKREEEYRVEQKRLLEAKRQKELYLKQQKFMEDNAAHWIKIKELKQFLEQLEVCQKLGSYEDPAEEGNTMLMISWLRKHIEDNDLASYFPILVREFASLKEGGVYVR